MNTTVTLGGIAIGLAILYANLKPWWKGGRDPMALAPYGAGSLLGVLATVCVGGLLGWGAAGTASRSSSIGEKGVSTITGQSGSASLPVGRMGALIPEGGVVTTLIFIAVVLLFRASDKKDKWRIVGGFVTFAILAFLPGMATALEWLPDLINTTGTEIRAALSKGSS